jgi:hypothetical protein
MPRMGRDAELPRQRAPEGAFALGVRWANLVSRCIEGERRDRLGRRSVELLQRLGASDRALTRSRASSSAAVNVGNGPRTSHSVSAIAATGASQYPAQFVVRASDSAH